MNRVYIQLWEESERGWGIRPDGCSLHICESDHKQYISDIYNIRQGELVIPDEYDRISGNILECFISDTLFDKVKEKNNLRLMEYELTNLSNTGEIIFKP